MRKWILRLGLCLMALSAASPAPAPRFLEAVEFPYYTYPRALWERELVWLKTIGVQTVEFSIPWNWHEVGPAEFDFTGRTSPRRDLVSLVRLLRKLELRAWVRPLPPVSPWLNDGRPSGASDARAQRVWLRQLEQVLATQTVTHGGAIQFVEGAAMTLDAAAPPAPVTTLASTDPGALGRSRDVISNARGSLLWTGVEDALYPAGWEPPGAPMLRKGAVGLSGDERPEVLPLRRSAALLRNWAPLLSAMERAVMPKPAAGKMPEAVTTAELISPMASAVRITNRGKEAFHDDLRVLDPASRRVLVIPSVDVPAGESLWLPLHVSLGNKGPCRECANFSADEHIVYATAELLAVEYENGILAMEFAAPTPAEVILQLARRPVGPYLAGGKPSEFDWDEKTLRARLRVPASPATGGRVRIGIAMEEPDTAAFFDEAKRLMIGQKNLVSTTFSSERVAGRSRLRLPEGYTATAKSKSPNEREYEISVPANAVHGDWVTLALETDGALLGRARMQLFRPASVHITEAIQLHFGPDAEVLVDPPIVPIEPKAGTSLEVTVRNNSTSIQTYHLEASGEGLDFFPAKIDVNVAARDERPVSLRVFATEAAVGVHEWKLRLTGAAEQEIPVRALLLPRGRTLAWTADLDGDGVPEWILENQKIRAVFSTQDGGRWIDLTWKELNASFLPVQGALAGAGAVEVQPSGSGDALEFIGKDWRRTIRLADHSITVDQSIPLAADSSIGVKRGGFSLTIERPMPTRAIYSVN